MLSLILILVLGVAIFIISVVLLYHLKINFTKIFFFIFILFLVSAFAVILINHIDITEKGWITGFATSYLDWAKQIGGNIGEVTGQIVKQDWTPH